MSIYIGLRLHLLFIRAKISLISLVYIQVKPKQIILVVLS